MFNKIGSICGVVGFFISVFAWLGVSPDVIGQTVYNALYVGFPIASGAFGILAGWCLHGILVDSKAKQAAAIERAKQDGETERKKMDQEEREAERLREENEKAAAEARREQRLEDSNVAFIQQLEYKSKEYLWAFYTKGTIDLPRDVRGFEEDFGFACWVTYETVSKDKDRWRLVDWAKDFFDRHPELLEQVAEDQANKQSRATEEIE